MSKMSTTFRSVSYRPCSRNGVTCVASDFGGVISNIDTSEEVQIGDVMDQREVQGPMGDDVSQRGDV